MRYPLTITIIETLNNHNDPFDFNMKLLYLVYFTGEIGKVKNLLLKFF